MEVRIASTDLADSMLAHENRRVRVVEQVARDVFAASLRVPLRAISSVG